MQTSSSTIYLFFCTYKYAVKSVQNSKMSSHKLNHYKSKSNDSTNDNDDSTNGSENEKQDTINMPQRKNISASTSENQNNLIQQNNNKRSQEINISKYKKRKFDQTKSIDNTFTDISNTVINFLENSKEDTTDNVKTPDQSFVEYVCSHLEYISESEKNSKKEINN